MTPGGDEQLTRASAGLETHSPHNHTWILLAGVLSAGILLITLITVILIVVVVKGRRSRQQVVKATKPVREKEEVVMNGEGRVNCVTIANCPACNNNLLRCQCTIKLYKKNSTGGPPNHGPAFRRNIIAQEKLKHLLNS